MGPLLFNIILADLFFTLNNTEIANYADDIMPYTVSDSIDDLISSLEGSSKDLLKWFDHNLMKSNPDRCNLLVILYMCMYYLNHFRYFLIKLYC